MGTALSTLALIILWLIIIFVLIPFIRILHDIRKKRYVFDGYKPKYRFKWAFWNDDISIPVIRKYLYNYLVDSAIFFIIVFAITTSLLIVFFLRKGIEHGINSISYWISVFPSTIKASCKTLFLDNPNITFGEWLSFLGALLGGLATLIGVVITIKTENKKILDERYKAARPILFLSNYSPDGHSFEKAIDILLGSRYMELHKVKKSAVVKEFFIKNHGGTCIGLDVYVEEKTIRRRKLLNSWITERFGDYISIEYRDIGCGGKSVVLEKDMYAKCIMKNCIISHKKEKCEIEANKQWEYDRKGFPILAKSFYTYEGCNRIGSYVGNRWNLIFTYSDIYGNKYYQIHKVQVMPKEKEDGDIAYSINISSNPKSIEMKTKSTKGSLWMINDD